MKPYEDLVITARTQSLDRNHRHAAFGTLVKTFQHLAYNCAYKLLNDPGLAEDITQEAFITAYQKLHQLRDPGAFPGWLCQITRTQCHRWQRQRRVTMTEIDSADTALVGAPGPEVNIEQRDLAGRVLAAIDALPEHEQIVIRLFYLQGYSIKEIGEMLCLPLTTIKKRLQYARGRMKQSIVQATQGGPFHFQIHLETKFLGLIDRLITLLQPKPIPSPIPITTRPVVFRQPDRFLDGPY